VFFHSYDHRCTATFFWITVYTVSQKIRHLQQMLTNFRNSITDRLVSRIAITLSLNIPPRFTNVVTLLCEIAEFKNYLVPGVSEANCYARLSYSKSLLMIPFTDNKTFSATVLKIPRPTVRNCLDKE